MNIGQYIKELLYKYDRVVIPGFGAFFSTYSQADINKDTNTISPPTRNISFNSDIKKDDGLFIKYLIRKENIDEVEARKQLNTYIFEIRKIIKEKGYFLFKGIGKLFFDKGRFIFEPYSRANFLYDSFAMTNVKISSKVKEIKAPPTSRKEKKQKANNRVYDRERTIKRIWIYAPVTAALVFLFVYIDTKSFSDEELYPVVKSEYTVKTTIEEPVNKAIVEAADPVTDKKEALFYNEPPKESFYIIAGSFKEFKNAHDFYNELKNTGYKPYIINKKNGLFRVSIGSYETKAAAQNELNKLRSSINRSLWIYTQ